MKIGIDIDDTTFLTVKSMLKYADIFEEEISGVPTNRDSFGLIKNRYYLKDRMNLKFPLILGLNIFSYFFLPLFYAYIVLLLF